MNLGFIGTGAITEAMVEGFIADGYAEPIVVSERSRERSARLAERHHTVIVEADNQAIVDRCDWVVISVLPPQALDVASGLRFREDHNVISVVAGIKLATWAETVAPAKRVWRAVPMPPIEKGWGPTAICPPDPEVEALFSLAGTPVAVDDERQFQALAVVTSLMGMFFEQVGTATRWLEDQGVPEGEAAAYSSSMFQALANLTTLEDAQGLKGLSEECLTVGGVNEQVLHELRDAGWFDIYRKRLDRIMERFDNA